ncbi:site-specific integrase [Ralstonia pseudosolanacearum]|uniref:site-specific integrase n=1 Tax=Ralstonia pseudosolanacearum TaxID=1310165 RepID=UPI003529947D
MERGVYIDRTEAEKNTLGDLLQRSAVEVSSQKKGRESERYRVASLLRDPIAKTKVAALSGKLMAQWRDKRLKEVSGSTTNRDLNLISHVINVARKEWGVHVDHPISKIRRPPENRGRTRRLALGEDERLLAALDVPPRDEKGRLTGPSNPCMRPLVILAVETAMRRSEFLALRWQDVELQDRFVRLHDTKNGDARDVPLSTRAASMLAGLPRHISGQVFPVSADAVKKSFSRAAVRISVVRSYAPSANRCFTPGQLRLAFSMFLFSTSRLYITLAGNFQTGAKRALFRIFRHAHWESPRTQRRSRHDIHQCATHQ